MKFILMQTSEWENEYTTILRNYPILANYDITNENKIAHIEINSIDDLMKLQNDLNQELIITLSYELKLPVIEIYDGWRE